MVNDSHHEVNDPPNPSTATKRIREKISSIFRLRVRHFLRGSSNSDPRQVSRLSHLPSATAAGVNLSQVAEPRLDEPSEPSPFRARHPEAASGGSGAPWFLQAIQGVNYTQNPRPAFKTPSHTQQHQPHASSDVRLTAAQHEAPAAVPTTSSQPLIEPPPPQECVTPPPPHSERARSSSRILEGAEESPLAHKRKRKAVQAPKLPGIPDGSRSSPTKSPTIKRVQAEPLSTAAVVNPRTVHARSVLSPHEVARQQTQQSPSVIVTQQYIQQKEQYTQQIEQYLQQTRARESEVRAELRAQRQEYDVLQERLLTLAEQQQVSLSNQAKTWQKRLDDQAHASKQQYEELWQRSFEQDRAAQQRYNELWQRSLRKLRVSSSDCISSSSSTTLHCYNDHRTQLTRLLATL